MNQDKSLSKSISEILDFQKIILDQQNTLSVRIDKIENKEFKDGDEKPKDLDKKSNSDQQVLDKINDSLQKIAKRLDGLEENSEYSNRRLSNLIDKQRALETRLNYHEDVLRDRREVSERVFGLNQKINQKSLDYLKTSPGHAILEDEESYINKHPSYL